MLQVEVDASVAALVPSWCERVLISTLAHSLETLVLINFWFRHMMPEFLN